MKIALIIGAASGIGLGISNALRNKEIHVIDADIAFNESEQTSTKRYVDASCETSITSLTEFLRKESIQLDYLIITIGTIDEGHSLLYPSQNLTWMLKINVIAPYQLVQHLNPFLSESNSPKILLTGSAAGLGSTDDSSNLMPYIVCKHALMGYFKVLQNELGKQGIQVSLLLPNRIAGKLSENSAKLRKTFLEEEDDFSKGLQPNTNKVVQASNVAPGFVEDFLDGKTYISNNPSIILDKLQEQLDEMKQNLTSEI